MYDKYMYTIYNIYIDKSFFHFFHAVQILNIKEPHFICMYIKSRVSILHIFYMLYILYIYR